MTRSNQFLAGTALCLLMAAAPLSAKAQQAEPGMAGSPPPQAPLILAQAEDTGEAGQDETGEDCPPGTSPTADDGGCVLLEDAPAEEEPPPADEAAEPAEPEADAPTEEAPEAEPAEPETEAPETEAPAEEAPEAEPEPAPETEEPAPRGVPAETAPETEEEPPLDEAPAAEDAQAPEAPAAEEPAEADCPPGTEMSAAGECIASDEAVPAEGGEAPVEEPAGEAPADDTAPAEEEEAPVEEPAEEAPAEETAPAEGEEAPVEEPAATAPDEAEEELPPAEEAVDEPEADAEAESAPAAGETAGEEEALPEDAAPVLDSQKEEAAEEPVEAGEDAPETPGEQQAEEAAPPESDAQAQQGLVDPEELREEIRALVQEEGERIELGDSPEARRERRRSFFRPREGGRVVEEFSDNRTIVEIDNRVYIESPDYERIVRQGDEVWYEELRGGRVREVVERRDGTRVITIRNRYGDVVRRVRVTPDGREYVLVYLPDSRFDETRDFRDPARELPPLRLNIPVSEYILEAERVDDPRRYRTFLAQPPVEPVRRLYSLEEVRHSARVRDMVRRIDLDTIEFEFGSARIEESEIEDLEALADAILAMLEENPAETFLIEGHTDAVGSDNANLALSDRRADAVARALTDVFGVPPENLVTQGYGEQYLKVETQRPERENRRVAVRRITPLVAPVASRR